MRKEIISVNQALVRLKQGDYNFSPNQLEKPLNLNIQEVQVGFWDAIGPDYELFGVIKPFNDAKDHFVETVENNLPDGDLCILDLGCGAGEPIERMLGLSAFKDRRVEYLGIDGSEIMANQARERIKMLSELDNFKGHIVQANLNEVNLGKVVKGKIFNLITSNWGTMYLPKDQQRGIYSELTKYVSKDAVVVHSALTDLPDSLTLGEVLTPYGKAQMSQLLLRFGRNSRGKMEWLVPSFIGTLKALKQFGVWTGGNDSIFPDKMSSDEIEEMMKSAGFPQVLIDKTQLLGTGAIAVGTMNGNSPKIFKRRVSPRLSDRGNVVTPRDFLKQA